MFSEFVILGICLDLVDNIHFVMAQSFQSNPVTAVREGLKQFSAKDIYKQVRQTRDMKTGDLVGTDLHGNRYFENRDEQFGRDRWVIYAAHMDFDPATVPAEWHAWLHHMTDRVPAQMTKPKYAIEPAWDPVKKTGRDTKYVNPGFLLGGKDRGDGLFRRAGSLRTIREWDPNAPASTP
uniref:NADH dehydrogenase [ubiquinone] 1 alpha subcomplex subunit 12 n=1 Tax=Cryptomonas curvata TaxID=233186 RepID=A0A7S0QK12_9CRYP|mmetsp:Transcript_30759/g.64396  ORF Transcript_30759/g.64396 Transcript_30759/m.64396 type:complete len:179 (+) Transcript_30759:234-770(+)